MRLELLCPACGLRDFDTDEYESMILLAQNLALVQFLCPGCGMSLSVTMRLTPALYREAAKRLLEQNQKAEQETSEAQACPCEEDTTFCSRGYGQNTTPEGASISYASHLIVDEEPEGFHLMYPLTAGNPEYKAQMEYFRRQLEKVDTVDEALEEIGSGYHRERYEG